MIEQYIVLHSDVWPYFFYVYSYNESYYNILSIYLINKYIYIYDKYWLYIYILP